MRRLVLLSAVVLLLGALAPTASAAPPRIYEGGMRVPTFSITEVRNTGTVNHFRFRSTTVLTGALLGETQVDMSCVGYEVPLQRAFSCHGSLSTTGTVAVTGEGFTTTAHGHFRCSFVTGRCTGSSVTSEATGAFAGTHGVAKTDQDVAGVGTYRISVTGGR